jgi:hypothetical protein
MSTDYSWHAIAVGNRLLGIYNFVVLKAPPTWRIIIMPMASDVFRHREINGVKWVRDGEVMHFIKDGPDTYTLRVVAKPGRKRLAGASIVINGHSGAYEYVDDGKRRVLRLLFYCDVTDRTVEIKIEGVKDSSPLYYLSQSQCH